MKRLLCPQLPKPHRPTLLPEDEANHAVRVLRLRDGDTVEAIDGQGHSMPAILRTRGGPPRLEHAGAGPEAQALGKERTQSKDAVVPVILELAVLKGDAMEWVVEKAVELGVRTLIPAITAHTVVQIKSKGPEAFRERWQKIADQALKQCGRLERMMVELPTPLGELLQKHPMSPTMPRYWCDEASSEQTPDLLTQLQKGVSGAQQFRLLIGPEGGWSEEERELLHSTQSAHPVSLGPLVLRAETAAVHGISLITATYRASQRLTKPHG